MKSLAKCTAVYGKVGKDNTRVEKLTKDIVVKTAFLSKATILFRISGDKRTFFNVEIHVNFRREFDFR